MAKHSKDWNDGYQAAIEAIKKVMQGDNSDLSNQNGSGGQNGDSLTMPGEVFDKASFIVGSFLVPSTMKAATVPFFHILFNKYLL